MIQSFRDLTVWQKSMDLAVRVYEFSEQFPRSERFGLTAQIRRAVSSIPSNIAEGKATGGRNYPRHLRIAHGSEAELQTQIELAHRLKFASDAAMRDVLQDISEVGRMIVALRRSLPDE